MVNKKQCSPSSYQALELFHLFRRCTYPTVMNADQVKGLMAKATKRSNLCGNAEGASAGYGSRREANAQHIPAVVSKPERVRVFSRPNIEGRARRKLRSIIDKGGIRFS